jgi:hypothetical protein
MSTNPSVPKPFGNHYVNLFIGVVGMLILSYANLLAQASPAQKTYYLTGAILLFISSLLERQLFFTILQVVLISGTAVAFATLPVFVKAAIPLVLSIIAIIYFYISGLLRDRLTFFGCAGMLFLAAGYAVSYPVFYFLGALIVMIFSFISYSRGVTLGLLWGVLNAIFTITAGLAVYHSL